MQVEWDVIVIGGGAAGFFSAINIAECNPKLKICILEKDNEVLKKVKISGGGRCNVTNACKVPEELIKNYPRGNEFLLNPFKKFGTPEVYTWFENRGVRLKIESDGRIFPHSSSSQTVIDCFNYEAQKFNIKVFKKVKVSKIHSNQGFWNIADDLGQTFISENLVVASGSDKWIWEILKKDLNIKLIEPVPSLFTFNIDDAQLKALQGLSFEKVRIGINAIKQDNNGAFLVTHWGISGPAVLKLSAWAARELQQLNYEFEISINWLIDKNKAQIIEELRKLSNETPKKNVIAHAQFGLPLRFWKYICEKSEISEFQKWAETGKKQYLKVAENLCECKYQVKGKSTFKEEFVVAGGVDLAEINPLNFRSYNYENLYFAGEVLNIDGITGGFNFQAAWTAGWHVAQNFAIFEPEIS